MPETSSQTNAPTSSCDPTQPSEHASSIFAPDAVGSSARSGEATPQPAVQAVLWDMDGTIVDTEPYWIEAQKELVAQYGGTWSDEQAHELVGSALERSAGILQQAGVDLPVPEIISTLTRAVMGHAKEHMPWRPGALELLREVHAAGIPTALVTMSFTELAEMVNDALGDAGFETLVTGDQVQRGKPDPEPYNLAFARLRERHPDLHKDGVVAIEDSLPGTRSAVAADLVSVAVPHTVALPADLGDAQWETLAGRSLSDLNQLVAAKRANAST